MAKKGVRTKRGIKADNEERPNAITAAGAKVKGFLKDGIYGCKVAVHNAFSRNKKAKATSMSSKAKKDMIFYVLMMAYPVLYFLLFYVAVNINSLSLAFKNYDIDASGRHYAIWAGFNNFKNIFNEYTSSTLLKNALANSFIVYLVGLLAVPLGLLFSFYIVKKALGHEFFKVMLFLPSILSSLILVIMFKYVVERLYPAIMQEYFGREVQGLLADPNTRFGTLLFYNIVFSFGTSVLIYSSAMDRIPDPILESARIEGVSGIQEFWYITLPLIFPTISTFLIVGVAGIFTNQFNLFSVYGAAPPSPNMYTLGYYLFAETAYANELSYPRLSAFGILFTAVAVPLTFGVRFLLEKFSTKGAEF